VYVASVVTVAVVENENDVMLANGELKRVNLVEKGTSDDCICLDVNDLNYCQWCWRVLVNVGDESVMKKHDCYDYY
jgi:hypothetical protein